METFDQNKHDQEVAERYRQLARFDAFDKFIDMALDGKMTMGEALAEFEADERVEA